MPSSPPAARRLVALVARAAAVLVLVLVPLAHGSTVAAALPAVLPLHARLVSSVPGDGTTVATADEVVLTFSEEVNPSFVAVTVDGPRGDEARGSAVVDGRDVTQPLAADLAAGEHVVTFRVVSADGHPVSGTVTFTTTTDASVQPSGGATASPPPPSPDGSATLPASPPAPATPADASEPASSESFPSTSWALAGIGALLLVLGLAGALWRSRRHGSGGTRNPEPDQP